VNKALLLDFNINRPFQYIESFRKTLKSLGIELNALSNDDVKKGLPEVLQEKFEECSFIIVRKPFAVLSGDKMREQVQNAVTSGKVNILVLFSFSEMEALELMNDFLSPFNIQASDYMVWDEDSNIRGTKKLVVFKPEAGAFKHKNLFEGVEQVVIPQPHHLFIQEPAVPVLVGNPTTHANQFQENPATQIDAENVVVGALNQDNGHVLVMDPTLFTNEWLEYNIPFLKNVLKWATLP